MSDHSTDRVCAVVVTFNRKNLLVNCLRALENQSRGVDLILVVDNASTDETAAFLATEFPSVEVLNLSKNGGGAGGFYAGMKHAFDAGFSWIWLMDDDGTPASDCLERLLAAKTGDDAEVIVPLQRDSSGRTYGIGVWDKFYVEVSGEVIAGARPARGEYLFAFVGPLISRGVIEKIGLPRREFFIWFDDYEYGLRLQAKLGARVTAVPGAIFHHDIGGKTREVQLLGRSMLRNESAAWKTYYGTRNHLFTVLKARKNRREVGWFLLREAWLLIGDVLFEPDRWKRARLRGRGLRDGALGRLGKRVSP